MSNKGNLVQLHKLEATSDLLEKASRRLAGVPNGANTALLRALNRTLENARAEAVRAVTDQYAIKPNIVRGVIRLRKAYVGPISGNTYLYADMYASDVNLPLKRFKVSPRTDTTGANRRKIRAEIIKGKPLGNLKQAFVWRGHVFERVGSASLPIEKRYGPAVPVMLGNEKVSSRIMDSAHKHLEKNLEHEIEFILSEVTQ